MPFSWFVCFIINFVFPSPLRHSFGLFGLSFSLTRLAYHLPTQLQKSLQLNGGVVSSSCFWRPSRRSSIWHGWWGYNYEKKNCSVYIASSFSLIVQPVWINSCNRHQHELLFLFTNQCWGLTFTLSIHSSSSVSVLLETTLLWWGPLYYAEVTGSGLRTILKVTDDTI